MSFHAADLQDSNNRRFSAFEDLVKVCDSMRDRKKHRSLLSLIGQSALDVLENSISSDESCQDYSSPKNKRRSRVLSVDSSNDFPSPANCLPALGNQVPREAGLDESCQGSWSPGCRHCSLISQEANQASSEQSPKVGRSPKALRSIYESKDDIRPPFNHETIDRRFASQPDNQMKDQRNGQSSVVSPSEVASKHKCSIHSFF